MFDGRFYAYVGIAALLALSPGATIAVITQVVIEDGRRAGLWTVLGVASANSTLSLAAAFGMSAFMRQSPWTLEAVTVAGACYLAYLGVRAVWRAAPGGGARRRRAGRTARSAVTAPLDPSGRPESSPAASSGGVAQGVAGRCRTTGLERRPAPGVEPAIPGAAAMGQGSGPARGAAVRSFGKGLATNLLNPSVSLFYMAVVPQFIGRGDPFLSRFLLLGAAHVTIAGAWHATYVWFIGTLSERIARPGVRRGLEMATGLILIALALRFIV
jgi:threonine/homoserine/homoserine lactone efflux protein